MAKRTKKPIISGVTSEQSEQAFADFAKADARIVKINADMDVQFTKIREKYADELNELEAEKKGAFEIVQVYATENKELLFKKKKSVESVHGIFGFRTGTPKVEKLKGYTWEAVAKLAKAFLPEYIRTSEELAKDKLLTDYKEEKVATKLAEIGVKITQEEAFYIERKTEEAKE